jgi:hypothetical protein
MKSIAGTFCGSHPDNMLILYKIRSDLECGCVCLAEMTETHFKKLKRVQWRGLRVRLALTQSTHTDTVEALSDVSPLDLRFLYLNQMKFLVYLYDRGNALRSRLKTLADLSRNIRENPWAKLLGIEYGRSYTEYSF